MRRRCRDDRGVIAGAEALLIGVVVMVAGALAIIELWGVLDARATVDDAAREAVRVYVESPDGPSARAQAAAAASRLLAERGRTGGVDTALTRQPWGRCVRVEAVVRVAVPKLILPGVGGAGTMTVVGRHSELIDPYRSAAGLPGLANCG
jgi:hypothetical protein